MSDQQSIPAQSHEPVCEHKGYRVYRTKTGFEAFKSGRRRKVGTRIDKHTGEEKDVLVASMIDRVVLPGDTVEHAIAASIGTPQSGRIRMPDNTTNIQRCSDVQKERGVPLLLRRRH